MCIGAHSSRKIAMTNSAVVFVGTVLFVLSPPEGFEEVFPSEDVQHGMGIVTEIEAGDHFYTVKLSPAPDTVDGSPPPTQEEWYDIIGRLIDYIWFRLGTHTMPRITNGDPFRMLPI